MGLAESLDEPRRKFTVAEVMRMVGAGVLGEDDRVELIEGELYRMSPQDPLHAGTIGRITSLLVGEFSRNCHVRVQLPLVASRRSLPEPDFSVVRGGPERFESHHPSGQDTILVVEVTWTSGAMDRRKAGIYARAGAPLFFRIDIPGRYLEIHEQPGRGGYGLVHVVDENGSVTLPGPSRRSVLVRELLPTRVRRR